MNFIFVHHIIQTHLIRSFAMLDGWLDRDPELLNFQIDGESSIAGMMKVIAQNNEHLLQIPFADHAFSVPYNLDVEELERAARQWRQPYTAEKDVPFDELRSTLRGHLETSLIILDSTQAAATATTHPLACAENGSWDGFHRLYFMGLLIRQSIRRFNEIHERYATLVPG